MIKYFETWKVHRDLEYFAKSWAATFVQSHHVCVLKLMLTLIRFRLFPGNTAGAVQEHRNNIPMCGVRHSDSASGCGGLVPGANLCCLHTCKSKSTCPHTIHAATHTPLG